MIFVRFPSTFFGAIFFFRSLMSFIFLLNSFKSLITSFLLYLSGVGQKLRFLFKSLYWYFVNENFNILITIPKGSARYWFVLSIVFRKRLMLQLLGNEILKFVLIFFFFFGLYCWQRPLCVDRCWRSFLSCLVVNFVNFWDIILYSDILLFKSNTIRSMKKRVIFIFSSVKYYLTEKLRSSFFARVCLYKDVQDVHIWLHIDISIYPYLYLVHLSPHIPKILMQHVR